MAKITLREVSAKWRKREAFNCNGTLTAGVDIYRTGRLSGDDLNQYVSDRDNGRITYVVRSYETPIAWVREDGSEFKVSQKFSVTTSKHQGKLY